MDDDLAFLSSDHSEAKSPVESPESASPPLVERRASTSVADALTGADDGSGVQPKPEVSAHQEKEEEEDDWLAGVLSRKKAQSTFDPKSKSLMREEPTGQGEELDLGSDVG